MFDFSWSEILLIGVVALVVIGPKDLPRVLKTAGQWMGRARAVAREFQFQVDQLVRESELDEVRKHMAEATGSDPNRMIRNWIDPGGEIERHLTTPELLGDSHTAPTPAPEPEPPTPDTEPELPLLAPPAPPPAPTLLKAEGESEAAAPAEVKSGTHG